MNGTVARRRSTYEANRRAERQARAEAPPAPATSARDLLATLRARALASLSAPMGAELTATADALERALKLSPPSVDAIRAATRRGRVALAVAADHMPIKENL